MDSAAGSVQSSSGGGGDDVSDSPVGFDAGELLANYGAPKFYPNSFASNPPLGHDGAWLHGATQPSRPSDPIQPPPPPLLPPPSVGKARLEQQPGSTRPKKRPRASRRAPTTVLTTDTSNFRQMVQKFTGVSTQSFSALARPCVDCFDSGAATARPAAAPEPKFLLRPFPQKVPITASFGPLPLPLGSISASRLPSTDSLPHPLPALDSLPLPVVGPTVSPSARPTGRRIRRRRLACRASSRRLRRVVEDSNSLGLTIGHHNYRQRAAAAAAAARGVEAVLTRGFALPIERWQ